MYFLQTKYYILTIMSLIIATPATAKMAFTTPYIISHPHLTIRSLQEGTIPNVRIGMDIFGQFVTLKLRPNQDLLHPNYVFQHLNSANQIKSQSGVEVSCHFNGHVSCPGCHHSIVALSTCEGKLNGLISVNHTDYFIEPLVASDNDTHFIYTNTKTDTIFTPSDILFDKSDWLVDTVQEQVKQIRRKTRTYSIRNLPYYLEVLVALDDTFVDYHATRSERYALNVLLIVRALLRRSLGQSITLVVSRLVALEPGTGGFQWSDSNPDRSLADFCDWQYRANGTQSHTTHDFAVLLTRHSLCTSGERCYVIGVANVGGMCSGAHSCVVVRDQGVMLSGTTVTHEIGHLFGMQHDESRICAPYKIPPSSHIMTQVFTASTDHFSWSECSKHSIAEFLSRGGDRCLLNVPTNQIQLPTVPLSTNEQCRSILGPESRAVATQTTCATITCHLATSVLRISMPLLDDTNCSISRNTLGRCQSGVCVRNGMIKPRIHGQWSQWDNWSSCSHSCDTGVKHRTRKCGAPAPSNGGNTCLGDRKQYMECKVADCDTSVPSRRTKQCRVALAHEWGTWHALSDNYRVSDPCHLICQQQETGLIAGGGEVADGTECHGMSHEEALCVLGRCIKLDCGGKLCGTAKVDACGICKGNGSTCHFVSEVFDDDISSHGLHRVFRIPPLARGVALIHLTPDQSVYLVVHQNRRNSLIRPNHIHGIQGHIWVSKRLSNGSERLTTSGPLSVPTEIRLWGGPAHVSLFLSYVLPPTIGIGFSVPPTGNWFPVCTTCNATCGTGFRHCHSICVNANGDTVNENICDTERKPANSTPRCENLPPCTTFFWATSDWGPCSAKCGVGLKSRQTICFARTNLSYRAAAETDCGVGNRPATSLPCVKPCATPHATAATHHTSTTRGPMASNIKLLGVWFNEICDCKNEVLEVECRIDGEKVSESDCDPSTRPSTQLGDCPTKCVPLWHTEDWRKCDKKCRTRRVVECQKNGIPVPPRVCHRANLNRPPAFRKDCSKCS